MTKAEVANPFILPKRSNPDDLDEEYDHKRFKQWIADLPIGDVSKTARALHQEIKRHNRLEMSPVERFGAVRLMLPALGFVLERLWAHISSKPIPLSKEGRLVARLHLELLMGVVLAYKTILSQFHDDTFTGHLLHKRARTESVRYALYFLGEILLHEYSIYQAGPKFVWKEMHGIYYYAVSNELQRNEKEYGADDLIGHMSIDDIYKRTLLLALADPGSLLRGEIMRVNDALIEWVPRVALVPVTDEVSVPSVFIVDATRDAPPFVAEASVRGRVRIGWFLLTDGLIVVLEREIGAIRDRPLNEIRPVELVTAGLYSKLKKRWGREIALREERARGSGAVEVACGLESLHWLFGGWRLGQNIASDFVSEGHSEDEKHGHEVHTIEQDEFIIDADAELVAAITAGSVPPDRAEREETESDLSQTESQPRVERCLCANRSRRGYHLAWTGQGDSKARVGDLVGVNPGGDMDAGGSWRLGVIRWIQAQTSGRMDFGIELISGDIEAIRLDYRLTGDSKLESVVGFQQKIHGRLDAVITKPQFFGKNARLFLVTADGSVPIVAGETVECTDAFMRFKVHYGSSVAEVSGNEQKRHPQEEQFDNIWDDL